MDTPSTANPWPPARRTGDSSKAKADLAGDADLLAMNPWRGFDILSPPEYL
jgi:predicted nucleic acid-binding protein